MNYSCHLFKIIENLSDLDDKSDISEEYVLIEHLRIYFIRP